MEAPADIVPSVEAAAHKNDDSSTKPALTPPTSEDMDKRDERMSSELSELDSDYDDGEEIEPDHYFEGGKIPVFKPTMEQFRNFKRFIDKVDKYGMKSGIVKVIPPKEWRNSLPDLSEAVKSIKVKNPITQEFAGQHGIYTQANIEKQRTYSLPEWRALTDEPHHQPPAKRGERRKAAAEAPSRTRSTRAQASASKKDSSPAPRRGPGRPTRRRGAKAEPKDDDDEADAVDVPPTPTSPGKEEKKSSRKVKQEDDDATPTKPRGRQPRSTASRRMNNSSATSDYIDEEAFEGFDYHLPNVEEFTVERCKELEENYWKTINFGQPMYGADMPGSLFKDDTPCWNVAKLPNLLDVLGTKVPGVNTAYLYLGMWKATFAWHLEDVDLYSINYIHFGAPKQWYSISQEDARRFEAAMKHIWPRDAKNCSQFLRHKTYLISPQQLEKQFNIKVNRLVHYEGEFVITYPYGYHSGYNIGYNCAESVNFANEAWLSYGRIAKKCECESDSVWVDVNEIERKLRGEPTPEYYEETDDEEDEEAADHLPSPPPSVAGKSKSKGSRKPAANKRKRGEEAKDAPKAKRVKRIRIRIRVPGKGMPCVLCPNDIEYDELLPTDNGLKAHRICADYTPETYISSKPNEVVCNVQNIGKDRLELKCNYCRSKRGAVFQCSQKKCTRAFHATCAAAAGVQIDLGPMPTFDEEGTEYFYDGYDFRCRFHRPKKRNAKTVDVDALEKDKFVLNHAKTLKPKDVVQFQYVGGEMYQIYGGTVVENRPGEQAVLIDVLPDGDRVEVEWKYLLVLDPADSQRPKPSANAKPLPEHLKESDASLDITNRTDGVPEIGDPFLDPNSVQKWAEFNTAPDVTKRIAKVDLSKENRLWYYLGKTSTEARPQYTEEPRRPRHNPKSNFLDTVKPPPLPIPPMHRQSYPASYPLKPSPLSIPRTPTQSQIRPADKPYQYKPKESMMTTWKSPVYQASTQKNPNSPVAHQPNVVYDHRTAAPQYGQPYAQYQNQRPSQPSQPQHQQYQPYVPPPPQGYTTHTWKAQPPPSGPSNGYAQPSQTDQAPTQYSYYHPGTGNPQQLPPFPHSQAPDSGPRTVYSAPPPQPPSRTAAPVSNALNNSAGTTKYPMYATAHSSSVVSASHTPLSSSEYIAYVTQYPYLRNAFLRRAKTYISPYSPDGGFTPEWMPKVPNSHAGSPATRPPSSGPGQPQGLGVPFGGGMPQGQPVHRPMPQFQSADAFQREMAKAPAAPSGSSKWDHMLKQIASSGAPSPSNVPASISTAHPTHPGAPHAAPQSTTPPLPGPALAVPVQSHTPPLPPNEPQRPIPSPLSDAPKSPKRPEYSPISDNGKASEDTQASPKVHTGETWRFS